MNKKKITNVTDKETAKKVFRGFELKILYNQNFIIKYLFVAVLHIYIPE